ncbi:MAG: patatin-like phospholipase family protein [Xanthobacteraceae bacterium]
MVPRRDVLLGTTAALLLSSPGAAAPAVTPSRNAPTELIQGGGAVMPIPADPSLGKGKDRALVLGGGGEYFIAWLIGFARGLAASGVDDQLADVIVGTSAGAVTGCALAAGHIGLLRDDIGFFGTFPKVLAALVPTTAANPSQIRARQTAEATRDGSTAAIQSIGRAAMAARNPSVIDLQLMIDVLSLDRDWPSPKLYVTTTDCYSGERLVVAQSSEIPISHAVCASVSLPGVFGPTWIGDRVCMDGAMNATSTHVDLVAGAKRALVVALTDPSQRFSHIPNDIEQELKNLEAAGTRTLLIAADPGKVHLLSADEIEPALRAGRDRAVREAERIKAFWA